MSPGSIASPAFKHGWYSRYEPWVSVRRQAEERDRRDRRVAARMEKIRAEQAERDARKQAQRDREQIDWTQIGPVLLELADEHEAPMEPDDTAE